MESFLHFWNVYDTIIIQSLIGCILLMVVYLSIRIFFGGDESDPAKSSGKGVTSLTPSMTNEIEKTLQKILENQGAGTIRESIPAPPSGATSLAAPANAVNSAEIAKLQDELKAREKQLQQAEQQLQQALAKSAATPDNSGSAAFEEKVKDLESRLSEYEIISEDIADLSFYKEENARLQAEITKTRNAAGEAAPPAAEVPPVTEAPVAAASPPVAAPADESPTAPAEAAPAAAPGDIDDDLMKEFAAAVAEQKAATVKT